MTPARCRFLFARYFIGKFLYLAMIDLYSDICESIQQYNSKSVNLYDNASLLQ